MTVYTNVQVEATCIKSMQIQRHGNVLRDWTRKYDCHMDALKGLRSVHSCIGSEKDQGHSQLISTWHQPSIKGPELAPEYDRLF